MLSEAVSKRLVGGVKAMVAVAAVVGAQFSWRRSP